MLVELGSASFAPNVIQKCELVTDEIGQQSAKLFVDWQRVVNHKDRTELLTAGRGRDWPYKQARRLVELISAHLAACRVLWWRVPMRTAQRAQKLGVTRDLAKAFQRL